MMSKLKKIYSQYHSYEEYIDKLKKLQDDYQIYFSEEEIWADTSKNNIEQLNSYIQKYPSGRYLSEALQYIEEMIWDMAKKDNTKKSYEEYLTKYPNGRYANEAKSKVDDFIREEKEDELVWKQAKEQNTKKSYEEYLTKCSKGKYKKEATDKIDEFIQKEKDENIAWNKAKRYNTKKSYEEYLTKYPSGRYANEAKSKVDDFIREEKEDDEQAWLHAKKKNTIKAYQDYLSQFPRGKYAEYVDISISDVREKNLWEKAKKENTIESYEKYLAKYPNGRYANEAKSKVDDFVREEKEENINETIKDFHGKILSDKFISRIKKEFIIPKYYGNLLLLEYSYTTSYIMVVFVYVTIGFAIILMSLRCPKVGLIFLIVGIFAGNIIPDEDPLIFISTEGYGYIVSKSANIKKGSKIYKFKDISKIKKVNNKYYFYDKNSYLIDSGKGILFQKAEEYWKKYK